MNEKYKYNAFLSYSHSADGKLAPAIQSSLEKFGKPWYKLRNLNVFRDESSLHASPHLWENIKTALDQSEYLIYLASPISASKKWVIKELEYWFKNKSKSKFLIVLTDGDILWDEINKSFITDNFPFPTCMQNEFTEEPLYIDLRETKTQEDLSLHNPVFKKEILKLAATIHGKEPKDLASEEVIVHRKTIRLRNSIIVSLVFLLIAAIFSGIVANKNRIEANKNALSALINQNIADSNARIAVMERDSALIAKRLADQNAKIAGLERDTSEIEKKNALFQKNIAVNEKNKAEANYLISEANDLVNKDPTIALRLAEVAMEKSTDPAIEKFALKIYNDNNFYKLIGISNKLTQFICFSKDRKKILTGRKGEAACLYDTEGNEIQKFKKCPSYVLSGAISESGNLFLTGSRDGMIRLWDFKGNILQEFKGAGEYAECLIFSQDENTILVGYNNGAIQLLDLNRNVLQEFKGHTSNITSIEFSPDGQKIVSSSWDMSARLWDLKGNCLYKFAGHTEVVQSAIFSPDGKYILTASWDATARLWNLKGQQEEVIKVGSAMYTSIAFSSDGKKILAGFNDNTIKLIDLQGKILDEFKGHTSYVSNLCFMPDGKKILSGSYKDHTARIWKLKNNEDFEYYKMQFESNTYANSVALSPNEKLIFVGFSESKALLWNKNGNLICEFDSSSIGINSAVFSPDGNLILTGSDDKTIRIYDLRGNILNEYKGYCRGIQSVGFSRDGTKFLSDDGYFAVLRGLDGKILKGFEGHTGPILSVAFSPDGKKIITSSADSTIRLWNLNGKVLKVFKKQPGVFFNICFSPDGTKIMGYLTQNIFGISKEGKAYLWNLNGDIIRTFGEMKDINSVSFSQSGREILTVSINKATLWNLNGNILQEFKACAFNENSAAFFSTGNEIITANNKSVVKYKIQTSLGFFLKGNEIEELPVEEKRRLNL